MRTGIMWVMSSTQHSGTGTYDLSTLGCKVNHYESQLVRERLEAHGLRPAVDGEPIDIAIVNTCAVTREASRKSRQMARRSGRSGHTRVIVMGCDASAENAALRDIDGVVAVWGHDRDVDQELAGYLARPDTPGHGPHISLPLLSASPTSHHASLTTAVRSFTGQRRAYLKIQDGCDAMCTYCIIPQLRPDVQSKPVDIAVSEAEGLVNAGHKEIIITGIFLGAYGQDTALRRRRGTGSSPLATLVQRVARIDGLERLRLSSLEPGDIDDALVDVLANHPACVPHLHLPLQSGGTDILRRMNRQYTRDDYMTMIDMVAKRLDRPSITTDIIVGFPGETEDDFQASLDMARYAHFSKIHAFPFSARDHTAAARWQQQFIPPTEIRSRMNRLAALESELSLTYRTQFIGHTERVLVERRRSATGDGAVVCTGRADRYFEIHFEDHTARPGDLVNVRIDRVTPQRTHGSPITSA